MADERLAPPVQAQGHVLDFDNKSGKGHLVYDLWLKSHFVGSYKTDFVRKDLHENYSQPQEADRVRMLINCGYDNQPWCPSDGSIDLICRATLIDNSNAS